jgi:hypothetical protein
MEMKNEYGRNTNDESAESERALSATAGLLAHDASGQRMRHGRRVKSAAFWSAMNATVRGMLPENAAPIDKSRMASMISCNMATMRYGATAPAQPSVAVACGYRWSDIAP